MTERTYPIQPPTATSTQSALYVTATSHPRDSQVPAQSIEEEPYTIKCICDYADDDGNTIFCEPCDTWQHIECYYHGNADEASRDDFSHYCADCKPRFLDRRKATERQRKQREDRPIEDNGDKKSKRPPQSKSHKKKPKPADLQTNGYHDHDSHRNGSPHEQSHKKSKSIHRSHHSISSQAVKQSPSHASRHPTHNHPLSPATTPPDDFLIQSYAKQLRDLYENDPGAQELQANSFASLSVTSTMSLWLRDPHKLRKDTDVDDPRDAFQMMKPEFNFAAHTWPRLYVNTKEIVSNEATIPLRFLSVLEPLKQHNALVGELKGFVGLQKDYYIEETDRFTKLCHPAPFVFFPPNLPLYIDTRREGSQCRYIRRSCRPNTTLDTYITNQSEYHFCVVNERPLASNEQITLAWDFKFKAGYHARYLQLLGLSDDEVMIQPEISDAEYEDLTELIRNVLSEYGGCACGLESDCAFVRFHRNYRGKLHPHSNGTKPTKKGRRPKHHISPTSTGNASNSRDASEGRQEMYDAEDDSRSTSGSVRSKPQSRDMTPLGDNGIEAVSEREKRKLENIERTFERLDQAQQPPKKKKRTSDGPMVTSPLSGMPSTQKLKQRPGARSSISNAGSTQANGFARSYKDAGTSRQLSNSPTNPASPKIIPTATSRQASHQPSAPATPRRLSIQLPPNYTHASTQTDLSENTWYNAPCTATPKKCFVPLSRRLFNSHLRLRAEKQLIQASLALRISNGVEQVSSVSIAGEAEDSKSPVLAQMVVEMTDPDFVPPANNATSTGDLQPPNVPVVDIPSLKDDENIKSATSAWPHTQSSIPLNSPTPSGYRSVDLKVQMPPARSFSNSTNIPPSGPITPSSLSGSVAQSPYGSVHYPSAFSPSVINSVGQHPSPVRKKLSFAAYSAMKKKNAEASSINGTASGVDPPQSVPSTPSAETASTMPPPSSLNDDVVMTGILDGSAIVESPMQENGTDGLAEAGSRLSHPESARDAPLTSTQV